MVCPFDAAAIVANDDNRANSAKVLQCHGQPEKMVKIEIVRPLAARQKNASLCCHRICYRNAGRPDAAEH